MDRNYIIGLLTLVGLIFALSLYLAYGEEKREVTLSGAIVCAHCTLKAADACGVALQAEDGNYFLVQNEVSDRVFEQRDKGLKAKVTGLVEEKDGKKWITASKIELEKGD